MAAFSHFSCRTLFVIFRLIEVAGVIGGLEPSTTQSVSKLLLLSVLYNICVVCVWGGCGEGGMLGCRWAM